MRPSTPPRSVPPPPPSVPPPSVPPPSSVPGSVSSGIDGLESDLSRQRTLIGETNVVYARLIAMLEDVLGGPRAVPAIVDRLDRAWRERRFAAWYERPLVLLASLRTDAIGSGAKHPLARALANDEVPDLTAITRSAVVDAMSPDRLAFWLTVATRRVQTNEVSRSIAWRWPAHLAGCDAGARPIALVDIGASGGLNLVAENLPNDFVDIRGNPLPVVREPNIVARIGFDIAPLDFIDGDDAAWARSCIWPGDLSRLRRFDQALETLRSMPLGARPRVQRLNATLVPARLPELLRALPENGLLVIYQTVMGAYMEPDKNELYARAMRAFIASSAKRAIWIALEVDDEGPPPASIVAHVADGHGGVSDFVLARCSYHPRVVDVRAGATAFGRAVRA